MKETTRKLEERDEVLFLSSTRVMIFGQGLSRISPLGAPWPVYGPEGMDTDVHIIEGSIQQSSLFLFEHYLLEYVKKE